MIVHASIDENGKTKGGKAGDQTKKEVCVRTWNDKAYNVLLRYPKKSVAKKAAKIAVLLANSNLVGYRQDGSADVNRNSLYRELKKNGFNVNKYIKSGVKTNCDCSSFLYAVWCCVIAEMRSDSNAPTTSTMRSFYKEFGFLIFTDSAHLTSEQYLLVGDILIKEGSHTVMEVSENAVQYYPKYTGDTVSLVTALTAVGETDISYLHRKTIAIANGIKDYSGTAKQNTKLLKLLTKGKLIRGI